MSFPLDLDEVLAFLDDFELPSAHGAIFCSTNLNDWIPSLLSQLDDGPEFAFKCIDDNSDLNGLVPPLQPEQQLPLKEQTKPRQKKRAARTRKRNASADNSPVPKAKKPRKRNRLEILKLREQINKLQARHAKLQQSIDNRQNQAQPPPRLATGAVFELEELEQLKQLQEVKTLNRNLRAAVASQLTVMESLQALLQNKVSPEDLELILESSPQPPAAAAPPTTESTQNQTLAELYQGMESQLNETDLICHGINFLHNTRSAFTTSNSRQDAVRGPIIELATSTPVPVDFQELGCMIWNCISEMKGLPGSATCSPEILQLEPTPRNLLAAQDKRVCMLLPSKFGVDLQVDGVVAFAKFREARRIVITIASVYRVNDSDLVVRETAWVVVSKDHDTGLPVLAGANSPSYSWGQPPPSTSLFQTFCRLHTGERDPRSSVGDHSLPSPVKALAEKSKCIREHVMNSLSDKLQEYTAQLQRSLLSEVEAIASNVLEVKHAVIESAC